MLCPGRFILVESVCIFVLFRFSSNKSIPLMVNPVTTQNPQSPLRNGLFRGRSEFIQVYHPQVHSFLNVLEDGLVSSTTTAENNNSKLFWISKRDLHFRVFPFNLFRFLFLFNVLLGLELEGFEISRAFPPLHSGQIGWQNPIIIRGIALSDNIETADSLRGCWHLKACVYFWQDATPVYLRLEITFVARFYILPFK